jgi:phage/plasmid-like protein (TIGR03299 family)
MSEQETQLISLDDRIGTDISNTNSFDDVMNTAGFGFNVERVPMHTPEGNIVKNNYIIRRDDTKRILGTCKSRYSPVQTAAMFEPFHQMVKKYGAEYETAGLISGGSKCWISAKLPGDWGLKSRPDDKVEQRIVSLVSHDGTKRNSYLSIAKRVFCNNMLSLLTTEGAQQGYSISHTKNWEDNLDIIQANFDNSIQAHSQFNQTANRLDEMRIDAEEVKVFTELLLPDSPLQFDEKGKEIKKRETSRITNRREQILDLFITGAGNRGNSRWDAFNAVTEYVDHHNNSKSLEGKNGYQAAERRFVSNLLGGPGDRLKQRGLGLLLNNLPFYAQRDATVYTSQDA